MPPKLAKQLSPDEMKAISKVIPNLKVEEKKKKDMEKLFDKKK